MNGKVRFGSLVLFSVVNVTDQSLCKSGLFFTIPNSKMNFTRKLNGGNKTLIYLEA